ncbi:MAG: DNA recombination protein RmuC [Prevotellaceae bacterium]|nr:DNA recombination protein RmuC [Prevotellaceae bacterium]
MTGALLFIIGAAIGLGIMFIVNQRNANRFAEEKNKLTSDLSAKSQEVEMSARRLKETINNYEQRLTSLEETSEKRHRETIHIYEGRITDDKESFEKQRHDLAERYEKQLSELKIQHDTAIADMNNRHERELSDRKKLMEEQLNQRLNLVQEQLNTTTEKLLKQRSSELDNNNRTQMSSIIEPLKAVMAEMKKSMDDNRESFTRSTASLGEQLKQMYETTTNLGAEAQRLSKALQTGPKVQGDFGEMKLNDLLDKFGFTKGLEYDVQYTMRDTKGNVIRNDDTNDMMRPDVILHYPDHKDVIIDAKASLTAFINYVNAKDDDERKIALNEHVKSVKKHVNELSAKNYGKYSIEGGTTLDFVIMFVPQEAAMQLAVSEDASLWNYAFEKNVLITGEQNLFALLRLLQISWTQERQAKNQEQVFKLANMLVERVGLFTERLNRIGTNIDAVKNSYTEAQKTLYGNQSILTSANKLVEMGAKESAKHPLPKPDEEIKLEE